MALYFGDQPVSLTSVNSGEETAPADVIQHADIPDYVKTAALEVAKKVKAVQTDESITFIAMSDAHQLDTTANIVTGNLHAGMAAKILAYAIPNLDFCCYLGDYTAGSSTTTIAEGKQHFAEINADIDEAFKGIPQFRTLGNHDSLQYSATQNGSVLSAAEQMMLWVIAVLILIVHGLCILLEGQHLAPLLIFKLVRQPAEHLQLILTVRDLRLILHR